MPKKGRWIALGTLTLMGAVLAFFYFSRNTLWIVEQACLFDHSVTGLPFPCLKVDASAANGHGVAILRAPLERSHIVIMPMVRTTGAEDPSLVGEDSPGYFNEAWKARHFVQSELKHYAPEPDLAMAVNSKWTRSQDQLHIHVDCVDAKAKLKLAQKLAKFPLGVWQASGLIFQWLPYWVMRIDPETLEKANLFRLVQQIPGFKDNMNLTNVVLVELPDPDGGKALLLLAGQSDTRPRHYQATGEDLLDHTCRQS